MTADTFPSPRFPDLDGKRAYVTGGATGIGRAIATLLAAQGVRVAVADLDGAAAERTGGGPRRRRCRAGGRRA
jgi:NAD(P)-dependent dehydrogenase (short-subunit alcohol dehydrogenase family)